MALVVVVKVELRGRCDIIRKVELDFLVVVGIAGAARSSRSISAT